jgi:hypothetical protein
MKNPPLKVAGFSKCNQKITLLLPSCGGASLELLLKLLPSYGGALELPS